MIREAAFNIIAAFAAMGVVAVLSLARFLVIELQEKPLRERAKLAASIFLMIAGFILWVAAASLYDSLPRYTRPRYTDMFWSASAVGVTLSAIGLIWLTHFASGAWHIYWLRKWSWLGTLLIGAGVMIFRVAER